MAKKKEYTFADEAQKIAKLFPRRKTDPIEKRDYKQAMMQLMQEQETARQELGLDSPDTMACGGKMKHAVGGPLGLGALSPEMLAQTQASIPMGTDLDAYVQSNVSQEPVGLAPMNTLNGTQVADLNQQASAATPFGTKVGDAFRSAGQSPYLPSAIAGLTNIGGNLLLAGMSKRNQPSVNPTMATAQKINLTPQAEQLRRDATTSRNINVRNARNLGLNAGATMANVGAANAGIDRGLGANLTSLYGTQEQFNVGTANQVGLANQAASNRAGMFNAQLEQQGLQDRLGYLSGAIGTIPGVMRDVNLMKEDEATREMYKKYLGTLGRNYRYTGNLMGPGQLNYSVRG